MENPGRRRMARPAASCRLRAAGCYNRSDIVKRAFAALACGFLGAGLALAQPASTPAPIEKAAFGKTKEGTAVDIYTLTNRHGMVAKISTYGATLTELLVPGTGGKTNVVLGYDTPRALPGRYPVLRRHRRPRGQPHRQGPFHARRQDLRAGHQQRPEPPARRHQGLRQGGVEGRAGPGRRRGRRAAHLPKPRRRGRLSRQPRRRPSSTR